MKRLKVLWIILALLLPAFLLIGIAKAAGPTATLTWVAPTTNTDGTPITGTLTYNIYQGAKGAEGATPVQTGVSALTLTITAGLVDGSTTCFEVTAVEGGQESARSNEACKTFPAATPQAPSLTVQ